MSIVFESFPTLPQGYDGHALSVLFASIPELAPRRNGSRAHSHVRNPTKEDAADETANPTTEDTAEATAKNSNKKRKR
jgi:hypothetical protein